MITLIELGQGLRRGLFESGAAVRFNSRLFRRAAAAAVTATPARARVREACFRAAGGSARRGSRVLAFFPYEGQFDPTRPAANVILRLTDYARLSRLAGEDVSPPVPTVRALSASHTIKKQSGLTVTVESEIDLMASGQGPFTWRIPVASARDIEATLDGKRESILIEPGGQTGTVVVSPAGSHKLVLRRTARARREDGSETLRFPVNAVPSARIAVDPGEAAERPVETNARAHGGAGRRLGRRAARPRLEHRDSLARSRISRHRPVGRDG